MTSLWVPVPFGAHEDSGRRMTLRIVPRNLLAGGLPGAGKSSLLDICIAAGAKDLNCDLCLLDPKKTEHALWAPLAKWHVSGSNIEAMTDVLTEIRHEIEVRTDKLVAEGRRSITPDDGWRLILVVIDELARTMGTSGPKKKFADLLIEIVSMGRAVGIMVVAATQKPSHTSIPTDLRDLFQYRWAGRCTTNAMSDTILGDGWAAENYSGKSISDLTPGVGWLLAEEKTPELVRIDYVDDVMRAEMFANCMRKRGLS